MKFKSLFLHNVASRWIKQRDRADALKVVATKLDWKSTARKCQNKISIEYKFWVMKEDSAFRTAKLTDMGKDIAFMNSIENKEDITPEMYFKLQQLKTKYAIE
jgi:hypothetical protein